MTGIWTGQGMCDAGPAVVGRHERFVPVGPAESPDDGCPETVTLNAVGAEFGTMRSPNDSRLSLVLNRVGGAVCDDLNSQLRIVLNISPLREVSDCAMSAIVTACQAIVKHGIFGLSGIRVNAD